MRILWCLLAICMLGIGGSNAKTRDLTGSVSNVRAGHIKFAAELIARSNERVTVRNTSTGEIFVLNSAIPTAGRYANVTATVGAGRVDVIRWSAINDPALALGTIVERKGRFVRIGTIWYALEDVQAIARGQQVVGRQAYGNSMRVERVDLD